MHKPLLYLFFLQNEATPMHFIMFPMQTSGVHYAEVKTVHDKPKPPSLDDGVQYQTILPQAKPANPTSPPLPAKSMLFYSR